MFYTYIWMREDWTPYYVGKGSKNRAFINQGHTVHKPSNLLRIFVQYWESEEKAFEMEKWYISFYGRKDILTGCLQNHTDGGENPPNMKGVPKSEEHKRKIGNKSRGRIFPLSAKKKLSLERKGKHFSFSTEFKKGQEPWNKGKSVCSGEENPFYGKKHTDETKRKISEANRGKVSAMKGRKHTSESKEKMRASRLAMLARRGTL